MEEEQETQLPFLFLLLKDEKPSKFQQKAPGQYKARNVNT